MSYRINRTDGELLVDLQDGIIDSSTTDLTLIGRNYKGFGEWINENFVKLLENFASTYQPSVPITGQLWYDKQEEKLKVFNGTFFKSASGTVVNSNQPSNLVAGDIWIDNDKNQLYIYDGTDLTLIGPQYTIGQNKTGLEVSTQIDVDNKSHSILNLYIGGVLVGIWSKDEFIIPIQYSIIGLDPWADDTASIKRQKLFQGFNVAKTTNETGIDGLWYRGTALNAKYLINDLGEQKESANFLPTDANGVTTGYLQIKNSNGLIIGVGDRPVTNFRVTGRSSYIENLENDGDFNVLIKNNQFPNYTINALKISASDLAVNLFSDVPNFDDIGIRPAINANSDMNLTGNMSVGGTLTVAGQITYVSSIDLKISDKQIELAINENDEIGNDTAVLGGGIILKSSDSDKEFLWEQEQDQLSIVRGSWTSNQDINLKTTPYNANPAFKIDNNLILTNTELYSSVTKASGLNEIGTLVNLKVDNIEIDNNSISRINGKNLIIDANGTEGNLGTVSFANNNRIIDLADPVDLKDATTKEYVDREIQGKAILLSLDINGLLAPGEPENVPFYAETVNNIRKVLNEMLPIEESLPNTDVKIMATRIREIQAVFPVTVSETDDSVLQKSRITVRNFNNTGTVTVVQDLVANPIFTGSTTDITFVVDRYVYKFRSDGANWNYISTDLVQID